MGSPQEAVQIVLAVQESQQFFAYVAVSDDRVCELCLRYDQGLMTRREIEGTFDYLEKQSDLIWFPRVHPNCRCALYLAEEDPEEIVTKQTNENGDYIVKDTIFDGIITTLVAAGIIVAGTTRRERRMKKDEIIAFLRTVDEYSDLWVKIEKLITSLVTTS